MAEQHDPPNVDDADSVVAGRNLTELVTAGFAAMAVHDWATARDSLASAAEADPAPSPEVLEGLAVSLYLLGFLADSRQPMERAFAGFREAGELRRAIQAAAFLVGLLDCMGQGAAAQGWEGRGKRLLQDVGACAEEGHLALARVGCNIADPAELEASAELALKLARRFGDAALQTRALGDMGLALVSQGRVEEGLALLDEAMVTVVSGEVALPRIVGMTICAMLSACERTGDLARAETWSREVDSYSERLGRPPYLYAHCHTVYGAVLALSGRWQDAESELLGAISPAAPILQHRNDARAQLAIMRIRQGRLDDAEEALAGLDHELEAAPAIAHLQFTRHDFGAAATTIERTLRALGTDWMRAAPLLALLVQVQLAAGDVDGARQAGERLTELSAECSSSEIRAEAHLATARVAIHTGDQGAVEELETALALLVRQERPHLAAQIRLEMARAMETTDPAAAVQEADVAAAALGRLGAGPEAELARALRDRGLPSIAVAERQKTDQTMTGSDMRSSAEALTRRETEVAELVALGLLNREIAERFFLSVRTVESHVNTALSKLGFRTRTQLARWVEGHVVATES